MANVTREILSKRMFADPKNYPYGFSRSGDFSINESKALAYSGSLFSALVDGVIGAETEEEKHFLAAAFGQVEAETVAERAWLKYQKRINRPKLGSFYGNKPNAISDDDTDMNSDDLELEVNLDEE